MVPLDNGAGALGAVELAKDESGMPFVRLIGEIDISNAEALGAELEQIVGGNGDRFVIDLAALEFMDSSGIAMLIRAAGPGGSIAVRNPTYVVRRIIKNTGLTEVLRIEPGPARHSRTPPRHAPRPVTSH